MLNLICVSLILAILLLKYQLPFNLLFLCYLKLLFNHLIQLLNSLLKVNLCIFINYILIVYFLLFLLLLKILFFYKKFNQSNYFLYIFILVLAKFKNEYINCQRILWILCKWIKNYTDAYFLHSYCWKPHCLCLILYFIIKYYKVSFH